MVNTMDLTRGPIREQYIALAVPLLMGNILQQLYNTVDAVIVGRFVGEAAFAAVGVAGSVMNLFLFLISGGCTGVGTLMSQLHGAEDEDGFRRDFFLSSVFGGGLTIGLTAIGLAVLNPLLGMLQTPEDVLGYAAGYLRIIYLGFIAAFAYHLCSAVLRAVGNTQAALVFLSISMVANLMLDLLFVTVFRWGVEGAAWATVTAQALAAVLCLFYLERTCPQLLFRRKDMVYDGILLRRTAYFSFSSALHMCSLYIGKLLVQRTVNGLGTNAISAYTGATRIEGFANSFGDSGSAAMSVFIGQNTGAGDRTRVERGYREGQKVLVALGTVMSLSMFLGASVLLPLVLPEGEGDSLTPAVNYLRMVACFYVFNFLGSGLAGYYRGSGRVNLPVIGSTGHISFRVVASWLLAPLMGLPAVGLATGLGWVGVVTFWTVVRKKLMKQNKI